MTSSEGRCCEAVHTLQNILTTRALPVRNGEANARKSGHCVGRFSRRAWMAPRLLVKPAPLLGEYAAQVFGEWLGMSVTDVDGLRRDVVV